MSIFKSTFTPFVKTQLATRQKAINNRTAKNLQYYNSRNAWIRMSSSVNVNGNNTLAKTYILQGGTLDSNKNLKSGLGDFSNAYSNKAADGTSYRLGIRPMPGITSLEIKSKSAYGSLREAVVNFQCWDIKQLEDLELLYMRPGYTVLIEWGWTPYLDNNGDYKSIFTDYYDIIDSPPTERTTLFRALYEKCQNHGGNYDAMFGYVRYYQWSARMDGGYDCQATVISTGELIESLKINYLNPKLIQDNSQGLLSPEFNNQGDLFSKWGGSYNNNILAGIWAEAYHKLLGPGTVLWSTSFLNNNNFLAPNSLRISDPSRATSTSMPSRTREVYITLQAMIDILNEYVIAKGSDAKPLIKLSLKSTTYDGTEERDLLCVAHPLQVSVNPGVCIIKNPIWGGGDIIRSTAEDADQNQIVNQARNIVDRIIAAVADSGTEEESLTEAIEEINNIELYIAVKQLLQGQSSPTRQSIQAIANDELGTDDTEYVNRIINKLRGLGIIVDLTIDATGTTLSVNDTSATANSNTSNAASQVTITESSPEAIANIAFINSDILKDYFYDNTYSEIGIIKNIYVNVSFLYEQALSPSIQSTDPKEKNEINLFSYLKNIMNAIQTAIGNVNSFGIHVDPVDNNVARIIDLNYTEYPKANYADLYELKIQSLGSVVRTYSLQSQIFPDQSTMVAIGAQAKGGQLGIQSNTLIDFNKNIIDRILSKKTDAQQSELVVEQNGETNTANITNALANIIRVFDAFDGSTATDLSGETDISTYIGPAQNSLKDLIVYFQSITAAPGSNRNLIPSKFSCEMDGIGGLVIGHMFKLPPNVMPKGYRGVGGVGVQLGNAVTNIGHTISNGDWVTKLNSLNIVLNERDEADFESLTLDIIQQAFSAAVEGTNFNINNISTDSRVAENSERYPVLVLNETFKSAYSATVQRYARVSATTPVADALRRALDGQYIIEKGRELSSNGDITEELKSAILTFQNKLKTTAGFEFIPNKKIIITAGNDIFHRTYGESRNRTTHCRGLAIDIRTSEYDQAQRNSIMNLLRTSGFVFVDYHGPVFHIHANISTAGENVTSAPPPTTNTSTSSPAPLQIPGVNAPITTGQFQQAFPQFRPRV